MKNVLITGGAGYIGSHIAELLIKKKINIFIVDNLSTGFLRLINKKSTFFNCNIHNYKKIRSIILKNNIDSIIHCAAKLSVQESQKKPKFYFNNNVTGTIQLIKAIKNTCVKNFIFSSTCAVYGSNSRIVNENSRIRPDSNYGKTKYKAELVIKKKLKNINYAILRYFNVIGASPSGNIGQINRNGQLFKNLSIEILKKKPSINVFGSDYKTIDGTCIRDYIHVSDLAEIHLAALIKINKTKKSLILNCGYGKGNSVMEIIHKFEKIYKKKIKIHYSPRRSGDIPEIVSNVKKLKKYLMWVPRYKNILFAIKSSVKWEKKIK
jgi:UDP-glucose 4-epimerase